ncbi:hypothetical protein CJ255_15985 [Candidatus Viridilinea mediisalina]|uniref:Uncharacterized protein n=2 Tax=Candidatus Viridilinea mediisalina TaxID=2024553 RepID=A0A2A6RFX8_9CHLR|nr:hypothetical protein CJ255_15985 [Candidatus Viridilinea mediisalina]
MQRMQTTFGPIMEVLDEGLGIYRRNFTRFMLLAGLAALPVVLVVIIFFVVTEDMSFDAVFLLFFAVTSVMIPVSFYIMGALSRASLLAAAGEPVSLRRVLAIPLLRVVGMGCYGTMFLIVASMVASAFSMIGFCILYFFVIVGVFAFASVANVGFLGGAAATLAFGLALLAIIMSYIASLVINGAVYGSTIYALQPFIHEELNFTAALQRSFDLVGYRFGGNLLAFLSASLVFGATALAATLAIGVFGPLPLLFLLGSESQIAQAVAATAWIIAIAAAAPLLPIWMTLLYQRRRAIREGEELEATIAD